MKLEGKVALVTGTSPNIGGGIAEGTGGRGRALVCVDSRAGERGRLRCATSRAPAAGRSA